MRREPIWVLQATVRFIHRDQIEAFGGLAGTRDEGMLESALSRPVNLWHYGEPTLIDLAAAYAYGIARNHPFLDGNKRTAFVVSVLFLELNGLLLTASEVDAAEIFIALAAGDLEESDLAAWFADHASP
jgi:death-on-curing protein